ncbi:hypothetical protein Ppa06_60430 [Planomonospora parontospora subsp. parontospora]|uniref:Uncharacterized protein n=2 Tax=Planomonospora parontospora TaxID=58119 RepID=A0AA37F7H5_9ACTN|nr:VCBS repeat-containing protein [Planomonospora parontospora]GGK93227.1 hypothetical protein GCM10010126_60640 [Planomonospora parontospora]GII12245.1 hypothetical protein Ppa06_60430 [Planomonospora parontospora subsp. parontospora]
MSNHISRNTESPTSRRKPARIAAFGLAAFFALASAPALPAASATAVVGLASGCGQYGADQPMTRNQVLIRAQSWLDVGIPYSQTACHENRYGDYRTDCSGYVSMAWGLSRSYTTRDIHLVSNEIPRSDLRPGDILNRYDDHMAIFVRWSDAARTKPLVREQAGSVGTVERTWPAATAGLYTPRRYHNIREDVAPDRVNQVNDDGYADLVGVDAGGKLFGYNNGSLINPGGQPYSAETWRLQESDWTQSKHIATGDINGDGYSDLVTANNDGSLVIYNNGSLVHPHGEPYLGATWSYKGSWQEARHLAVGDVTGDGFADIVFVGKNGTLSVYVNGQNVNPGGTPFAGATWTLGDWGGVKNLALTDVNRDGYADIVAVDGNGELFGYNNGTLVNDGRVPFASETWRIGGSDWSQVRHFTAGDVNRDGYGDLIAVEADGSLAGYQNGSLVNPGGQPFKDRGWRVEGDWAGLRLLA